MEGLGLDHWQYISKFLTIRELCRLMRVSRAWFHQWIDDRSWLYQEQRVCASFPDLKLIFDNCRASEATRKKNKTHWTIPRSGRCFSKNW